VIFQQYRALSWKWYKRGSQLLLLNANKNSYRTLSIELCHFQWRCVTRNVYFTVMHDIRQRQINQSVNLSSSSFILIHAARPIRNNGQRTTFTVTLIHALLNVVILNDLEWQQNFQRHGASRDLCDSCSSVRFCVVDSLSYR